MNTRVSVPTSTGISGSSYVPPMKAVRMSEARILYRAGVSLRLETLTESSCQSPRISSGASLSSWNWGRAKGVPSEMSVSSTPYLSWSATSTESRGCKGCRKALPGFRDAANMNANNFIFCGIMP